MWPRSQSRPGSRPVRYHAAVVEAKAPRNVGTGTHRLYLSLRGEEARGGRVAAGSRYLSMLGAWFRLKDDYEAFAEDLARMKRRIFGPRFDQPVIFRRRDIVARHGPFAHLRSPAEAERFMKDLATAIERARFTLVSVVLDKQMYAGKSPRPGQASQDCLVAVLKRYCGWLGFNKVRGDAMAESRGGAEDLLLKAAYRRVWEQGTRFMRADRFRGALTGPELKVKPRAANVAGLQLAAMLAQPLLRSRLADHQRTPGPADDFDRAMLAAATPKLNMKEGTGQVSGVGTVWISVPVTEADPGDEAVEERAAARKK